MNKKNDIKLCSFVVVEKENLYYENPSVAPEMNKSMKIKLW